MENRLPHNERSGQVPGRDELARISRELEEVAAAEILDWASETYGDGLTLSVSFGGAEGMVLLDMVWRRGVNCHVFTLDTGFLFGETVKFREEVVERYGMEIEVMRPGLSVADQARQFGDALYDKNPDLCCYIRKVEPQRRALAGYGAWISGIRRGQTEQRAGTPIAGWEEDFGVVKIAPLARWTSEQVQEYVDRYEVPLNPLRDQGYKSIGCEPCTRKVAAGEDARAGRWSGQEKTECGLHSRSTWLTRLPAEKTRLLELEEDEA
ncbi:MAG: phosphoadenylyl-sulfate reductase [Actinomycetota bacterium]|nr:phosphoadenylyl-sulfate reductase [Actinomycetota bacterium]